MVNLYSKYFKKIKVVLNFVKSENILKNIPNYKLQIPAEKELIHLIERHKQEF